MVSASASSVQALVSVTSAETASPAPASSNTEGGEMTKLRQVSGASPVSVGASPVSDSESPVSGLAAGGEDPVSTGLESSVGSVHPAPIRVRATQWRVVESRIGFGVGRNGLE